MSYGLEVWNAAGVKVIRSTDRLLRFQGGYYVSVPAGGTTTVAVSGMVDDGTWGITTDIIYGTATIYTGYFKVACPTTTTTVTTYCIVMRV